MIQSKPNLVSSAFHSKDNTDKLVCDTITHKKSVPNKLSKFDMEIGALIKTFSNYGVLTKIRVYVNS